MNTPNTNDLVETYLQSHFSGVSAAVFFDPLGDGARPKKIADLSKDADVVNIIHAAIYVLPWPIESLAGFVNRLSEDIYDYVVAWDGSKFVTENT